MLVTQPPSPRRESGMVLLEALIAILIFSLGVLGMVGINARAVEAATDARFRADAARFVSDIASVIALRVDRTTSATLTNTLTPFQHQPGGSNCAFTGDASGNADVTAWIARVSAAGRTGLPGATAARQQIKVETGATDYNRVTITVCWQGPGDPVVRQHSLITYIN